MISRHKGFVRHCLIAACALSFAAPAIAQDRAQLSGRVKDAQGASVPGATVSALAQQTQTVSVAVTDSTGFFTFPNLRSGRYDVSAELQGFKKAVRYQLSAVSYQLSAFSL